MNIERLYSHILAKLYFAMDNNEKDTFKIFGILPCAQTVWHRDDILYDIPTHVAHRSFMACS